MTSLKRHWAMSSIWRLLNNKGSTVAYALLAATFTVVPEECFKVVVLSDKWPSVTNIIINRLIICVIIILLANIGLYIYRKNRKKVSLSGNNYCIQIEYGNLFDVNGGKKIIDFDECYSTKIGNKPGDIKLESVCGQYLSKYPVTDIKSIINKAGVKPAKGKSEYNGQTKYTSGTIVPHGDYFLMAFAKLDKYGRGVLTYDQYIECLNTLWQQIDLYHGTSDVYMPILGSKITRFDKELTQQELLDIIISSYRLSPRRLRKPYKLHIICKEREGFSLNDIFGVD